MARIPLIVECAADKRTRAALARTAYRRGKVLNLYRGLAHRPEAVTLVSDLGRFLRFETDLPPRLRESVILAVAAVHDCEYEWQIHARLAIEEGVPETVIDGLRHGDVDDPYFSAKESVAIAYALQLARDRKTDGPTYQALASAHPPAMVVTLHLLVGYYSMLALILNGLAIDPEE